MLRVALISISLIILNFYGFSEESKKSRRYTRDSNNDSENVNFSFKRSNIYRFFSKPIISKSREIETKYFFKNGISEPKEKGLNLATDLTVTKLEGDVKILSPGSNLQDLKLGQNFSDWDKGFTGLKSFVYLSLGEDIKIEVSKDSSFQLLSVNPKTKVISLRLLKGQLRARILSGLVYVETLNAKLKVSKGYSDIIIRAMNTLVAPREGEAVTASTQKVVERVKAGYYGLITAKGDLIITEPSAKKSLPEPLRRDLDQWGLDENNPANKWVIIKEHIDEN